MPVVLTSCMLKLLAVIFTAVRATLEPIVPHNVTLPVLDVMFNCLGPSMVLLAIIDEPDKLEFAPRVIEPL